MSTGHPFANRNFLRSLEESGSVGSNTGWLPKHFETKEAFLASYIKMHSYGEYIFDWNWAEFYQMNNLPYYPKLLHAIPFTPVNAPKFLGKESDFEELAKQSFQFYQSFNLSSEHYLFINDKEEELLKPLGFEIMHTHQYHFKNQYESFDDFLDTLKKTKRKNMKKERKAIADSNIEIKRFTQDTLSKRVLEKFYTFYLSTIAKKMSYAYLTEEFFTRLDPKQTLIICAEQDDKTIAMALFFYNKDTLYGRLWGILPGYEQSFPFLHFELCYYQGIDFCIMHDLKLFEAGAQGEHKLSRGFEPVLIKSAHHIKIPQCFELIKKDIKRINSQTKENLKILKQYLPFKA